jgi:hypothetical protein
MHVCPWNFSKLMEPVCTNAFVGPQHDDILGAQWSYGDPLENNDTPATATDLGLLQEGLTTLTDVSCNSALDNDWYQFSVGAPAALSVTMTPVGTTYLQGPEGGTCSTGTSTNSLVTNDLGVSLHDLGGAMLASANTNPAGIADTIPAMILPVSASTFRIEVFPGIANGIQLYRLDIAILPLASGSSVGSGCGSPGPTPVLSTTNPVLGTNTILTVSNAKPDCSGLVVASYGTASPSPLGSGCTAWVDLASCFVVNAFTTNGAGTWAVTMALPPNPGLGGTDVAIQAVVLTGSPPLGFDLSNGLSAQLGY